MCIKVYIDLLSFWMHSRPNRMKVTRVSTSPPTHTRAYMQVYVSQWWDIFVYIEKQSVQEFWITSTFHTTGSADWGTLYTFWFCKKILVGEGTQFNYFWHIIRVDWAATIGIESNISGCIKKNNTTVYGLYYT